MSHVTPLSLSKECIVHCRIVCLSRSIMLPSLLLCRPMFKGDLKKFYLCNKHNLCVSTFESFLWLHHTQNSITLFRFSCHRCGIIMALLQRDCSYRIQLIIQELVLETMLVPWGLYALMTDSLTLDIGSHHQTLIERFNWVFEIKLYIHTWRLY